MIFVFVHALQIFFTLPGFTFILHLVVRLCFSEGHIEASMLKPEKIGGVEKIHGGEILPKKKMFRRLSPAQTSKIPLIFKTTFIQILRKFYW
jgi:hypothetical protein